MGEELQGHVRAAPGAVDREEAQARAGQAVQMAVGMGHELVALLGGRVQAHGVVHVVVLREGLAGVEPVDRRGGREDEVLHAVVAAAFQQVGEAHQVGIHIGHGIDEAVAHAGLGRHVDGVGELFGREQGAHGLAFSHVLQHETETGAAFQPGQTVFLELDVVIVVEVVQAGNENMHAVLLLAQTKPEAFPGQGFALASAAPPGYVREHEK